MEDCITKVGVCARGRDHMAGGTKNKKPESREGLFLFLITTCSAEK
jgi:hypothetical protein